MEKHPGHIAAGRLTTPLHLKQIEPPTGLVFFSVGDRFCRCMSLHRFPRSGGLSTQEWLIMSFLRCSLKQILHKTFKFRPDYSSTQATTFGPPKSSNSPISLIRDLWAESISCWMSYLVKIQSFPFVITPTILCLFSWMQYVLSYLLY